jgi:hypothetical protein
MEARRISGQGAREAVKHYGRQALLLLAELGHLNEGDAQAMQGDEIKMRRYAAERRRTVLARRVATAGREHMRAQR